MLFPLLIPLLLVPFFLPFALESSSSHIEFDALVAQIKQLKQNKPSVVLAISGFGGSGKSHLADKLRDEFALDDRQIIRIDHLYGPNPNGPDIFDQTDWALLKVILDDVHKGNRLRYEGKGHEGEPIYRDEELPSVVIVEGIRLLQPRLMPYFDLSIWIDCPQDVALPRAKARDRAQGEPEETVALWDSDWGPKDRLYYETYHPKELASYLFPSWSPPG